MEPKIVSSGGPVKEYELGNGVVGYAIEQNSKIYIPVVRAKPEGKGLVGKWLDELSPRCVFPTVVSAKFQGMLQRRGYVLTKEWVEEIGEYAEVWIRQAELP